MALCVRHNEWDIDFGLCSFLVSATHPLVFVCVCVRVCVECSVYVPFLNVIFVSISLELTDFCLNGLDGEC